MNVKLLLQLGVVADRVAGGAALLVRDKSEYKITPMSARLMPSMLFIVISASNNTKPRSNIDTVFKWPITC